MILLLWQNGNLNPFRKIANSLKIQTEYVFSTNEWLLHTYFMGLLMHSWFEIMEFSQIFIISAFWHWKLVVKQKWSKFSKKRQYFWIICVKSNLIFCMCRKEIWSFLKVLDYQQILEELINLRLKCSFLNLAGPSHPQESTSHPIFMHSRPVCLLNMKLKTIFHCSSLTYKQEERICVAKKT